MWDWDVWFFIAVVSFIGGVALTAASYWVTDLLDRARARARRQLAGDAATFGEPTREQVEHAVPPAFVCPHCGASSWHPEDGRHGWCGRCHAYTGRPAGLDIPTDQERSA